jgi:hypothetical protein
MNHHTDPIIALYDATAALEFLASALDTMAHQQQDVRTDGIACLASLLGRQVSGAADALNNTAPCAGPACRHDTSRSRASSQPDHGKPPGADNERKSPY